MAEVTIAICTYNRCDLLKFCLQSLVDQNVNQELFSVLIIDNRSTDNTSKVINEFECKNSNFSSVVETKQGLSHARNRAIEECKTPWITYFDDDAKAFPDFIENIIDTTLNYDFDIIGGKMHDWFMEKKPDWYHDLADVPKKKIDQIQKLKEGQFALGGIMTINMRVFQVIDGFNPELGMNAESEFYGEEVLFQVLARKAGFTIGYNPSIQMYHLVRPEKLSVKWHLNSNYLKGRSSIKTLDKAVPNLFIIILKALGFVLLKWPNLIFRLMFNSNFHKETFIIRSFGPLYYLVGQLNYKK